MGPDYGLQTKPLVQWFYKLSFDQTVNFPLIVNLMMDSQKSCIDFWGQLLFLLFQHVLRKLIDPSAKAKACTSETITSTFFNGRVYVVDKSLRQV